MSELQDGYNIVGLSQVTCDSLHEAATDFRIHGLIFTIYGFQSLITKWNLAVPDPPLEIEAT